MAWNDIITYAPAAFCLAFAAGASFIARRHATLDLGLTLCLCSITTTIMFAALGSNFSWQLMLEVLMAALIVHRCLITIHLSDSARAICGLIMLLAAVDVAFCAVVAVRLSAFPGELGWYRAFVPWVTNPIFLMQAALTAWPGIRDGIALHHRGGGRVPDRALDHQRLHGHPDL